MRILHIGKYYAPQRGGIERYTQALAEWCVSRGDAVAALVHQPPGRWRGTRQPLGGVEVRRAGCLAAPLYTPLSPSFPLALARVLRHVRANLTREDLTLAATAEAAFLSPNYLAHLVRKETGSTFTDLVTERRIALAQSLLAHTSRRIADIARSVGFRDEGYFARRFRARVGVSPKAYRDANAALPDADDMATAGDA